MVEALVHPRTAWELLPVLFGRELANEQLMMAMGECLAHLNHLVARGSATRALRDDGVEIYRAAPPEAAATAWQHE